MTDAIARCACGEVELGIGGRPILAATCYCDDCQAGARQIGALPGAPQVATPDGGTPYVLYRRDRVAVTKGGERLRPFKLRPGSATTRVVAGCCNSAMMVVFDRGPHWISAYREHIAEDAPPIEMRVQTKFAPAPGTLPHDGVPTYRTAPLRFVLRLLGSLFPLPVGPGPVLPRQ